MPQLLCLILEQNPAKGSASLLRVPISVAIILLIAFGGATVSTVYALKATVGFGSINLGAWKAWPAAHTEDADPYAKAHRARTGKLLLGDAEGLVFYAERDNEGNRLVTNCRYNVVGETPPARFWTVHATDANDVLLEAGAQFPSAYHSHHVLKGQSGEFEFKVSNRPQPGNWLATGQKAEPFKLVLTLFDSPTIGSSRFIDLQMPDIFNSGCPDG